jgi:hypothetical protein
MFRTKTNFDIKRFSSEELKEKSRRIYDCSLNETVTRSSKATYQKNLEVAINVMHNASEGKINYPYGVVASNASHINDVLLAIKHLQVNGYKEFPLRYQLVLESYDSIIGEAIKCLEQYLNLFNERGDIELLLGNNSKGDNYIYVEALEKFKKDINENLFKDLAPETSMAK